MIAAWLCRVPTRIYYVHGLRYQGVVGFKKKLLMAMERVSCKLATSVYAVSHGVKEVMHEDKITKKEIQIIWNGSINGIDGVFFNSQIVDSNNLKKQYGISEDDFVFGFIGRVVKDKGINELVSAFKTISNDYDNVKLIIAGNFEETLDPLLPEIKNEIHANPNIILVGFQTDIRPFYKMMDLFVFPSYREGFGISLMEAAAMNIPSISSDIIGCNEIIAHGVNGFLIPSKNEKILYETMLYCLQNRNIVEKMASVTRDIILSKFEQKQLWDKTISSYKETSNYYV